MSDSNKNSFEKWIILIGALFGIIPALYLFETAKTPLTGFSDRIIGICALYGIDPSLRTFIYIKIILAFMLTFCAVYVISSYMNRKLKKSGFRRYFLIEKKTLSIISGVALCNLLFFICTQKVYFKSTLFFLIFISFLILISAGVKYFFCLKSGSKALKNFPGYSIQTVSFLLPYQLILGFRAYTGRVIGFDHNFYLSCVLLIGLFYLFYFSIPVFTQKKFSCNKNRYHTAFLKGTVPLIFIPLFIPLSNEIQYTLSKHISLQPEYIALSIILLLVFLSIFLFLRSLKTTSIEKNNKHILSNLFYPVIIASDIILLGYQHNVNFQTLDMFHTGESALSVQHLLQFGKLPFIDFHPIHGLFDIFPQVLYRIINPGRSLDMLVWGNGYFSGWLMSIIAYLFFYFLIRKLTSPFFSLMVVMFLPILHVLSTYFAMFCVPAFVFLYFMNSQNSLRYLSLWGIIIFMVLWRIDFGITTAAGIIFVFTGALLTEPRVRIKPFISAGIIVILTTAILFTVAIIFRGESFIDVIRQHLIYIKMQNASQAYSQFISRFDGTAIVQYLVFPFVAVAYLIFYILTVLYHKHKLPPLKHMLTLFAVISLIMSTRSLQRHSHYEGVFLSYFFVFLICFSPYFFLNVKKYTAGWCYIILSAFLFIALPNLYNIAPEYEKSPKNGVPVFSENKQFTFKKWDKGDTRVVYHGQYIKNVRNVSAFLDHFLTKQQTFFDFSNSPLLYFYVNRPHPCFILNNIYQTSDSMQQYLLKDINKQYAYNNMPFIVFRQNTPWDYADDVPTEVRSYLLSEFFYKHYSPFISVENFEIWASNTLDKDNILKDIMAGYSIEQVEHFSLKKPALIHDISKTNINKNGIKVYVPPFSRDPYLGGFLRMESPVILDSQNRYYINVRYKISEFGMLKAYFKFNNGYFSEREAVSNILVTKNSEPNDIYIPVPLKTDLEKRELSDLRLDPQPNSSEALTFEVISADLIKYTSGNSFFPEPVAISFPHTTSYPQSFDLRMLPYVWAAYDDAFEIDRAEVLNDFSTQLPFETTPGKPLRIDAASYTTTDTATYLYLKIESKRPSKITLSYSKENAFMFDTVKAGGINDYLVRTSLQYDWLKGRVSTIKLSSTLPIVLHEIKIVKGD